MRVTVSGTNVALVGARKLLVDGKVHVGALIDEDADSSVLGPWVQDRPETMPAPDAMAYFVGRRAGAAPIFESLPDEQLSAIHSILDGVATELGLDVRR